MRITDRENAYVQEVLRHQFRSSANAGMTRRFEEAFAKKFNSKFAIAFANGTATMHAALAAAGVGPGDEVIVPPLTMASTALCAIHAGALPVFADVDPATWNLDPASVATRITPRTKAIIPVALFGLPPDMDPIMALARQHKLFVLEDDAQCFLGYYKGKVSGSIAHASSFSFQNSKHISCGEGGAITTNDEELAEKIRRMSSLGYAAVKAAAGKSIITREMIQDPGYLRHISIGWNYRLSELSCAVLLGQVERMEELVQTRLDAAAAMAAALGDCRWLVLQKTPPETVHSYWAFSCRLTDDAPCTWHEFRQQYLAAGGDPFYGAWALNYLEPVFRGQKIFEWQTQRFEPGLCPVAEKLQPKLLQFKTNYFDSARRQQAADALRRTIAFFARG